MGDLIKNASMNVDIDQCFERIFSEAAKQCRSFSTKEIVAFLLARHFPQNRNDHEDYQNAYDLTIVSLALARRPDTFEHLSPDTQGHFEEIKNRASAGVSDALKFHDECRIKNYFYTEDDYGFVSSIIYDHMILSHVLPEHYGPRQASRAYLKAVRCMADFWGHLLSGKGENLLFARWTKGKGREDFSRELKQAAFAATAKTAYTDQEISTFKRALRHQLVATGLTSVSMAYHPDNTLHVAGGNSGIDIASLTFPFDTRTAFTTYPRPTVKIYNGRNADPIEISIIETAVPRLVSKGIEERKLGL